ncbi:MAG: GT2 family glycosyltransferase [Arenicella sp.]|jgi:GT2 family glycosyltransferase
MPEVDLSNIEIIISTYNREKMILSTLQSLLTLGIDSNQIHVYDDFSNDNTSKEISRLFKAINLYRPEKQTGYIVARNFLIQKTHSKYILCLDDEAIIRNLGDLGEALLLLQNPKYAIFAYHIFHSLESPPAKETLSQDVRKIRTFTGCGFIVKREVIEELGLFDENYYFYGEEIDLSIRIHALGKYVITKNDLVVHHRVNQQVRKENRKGKYGYEWRKAQSLFSTLAFIRKNFPPFIREAYFIKILLTKWYAYHFLEDIPSSYWKGIKLYISRKSRFKRQPISTVKTMEWLKLPYFNQSETVKVDK